MATVTGLTAARMLEIEAACITAGAVLLDGHLRLTRVDGSFVDAGYVKGAPGPAGANGVDGADGATGPQGIPGPGWVTESIGANVNLDTKTVAGWYNQVSNTNATTALNYPAAISGFLEVIVNATASQMLQRYTSYNSAMRMWERTRYNSAWTPWRVIPVDSGGWGSLTFGAGYKEYDSASYPVGYRQVGNQVFLKGLIAPTTGNWPASTSITGVASLPSTYAPPQTTFCVGMTTVGIMKAAIVISRTPAIEVRTGTTASAYVSLDNISWFLD